MTALALSLNTRMSLRPGLWLRNAVSRMASRRALSQLEPHLLADIGISSAEARTEAARPPWDGPDHWRC